MNKKIIAALCLSVVMCAFLFSGCSNEQNFTAKTYSSGDTEVTSVKLDLSDREIEVKKSDDDSVHIEYTMKANHHNNQTELICQIDTIKFGKELPDTLEKEPPMPATAATPKEVPTVEETPDTQTDPKYQVDLDLNDDLDL